MLPGVFAAGEFLESHPAMQAPGLHCGFAFAARSDEVKTIDYCFHRGKPQARSRQSRVYRGDRRRLCDGVFSGSLLTRRRACKFSPQARFPCVRVFSPQANFLNLTRQCKPCGLHCRVRIRREAVGKRLAQRDIFQRRASEFSPQARSPCVRVFRRRRDSRVPGGAVQL